MKTAILILSVALAGCASAPSTEMTRQGDRPAASPVDVGIDWSWRVVGDAPVRPSQVFSMKGQTFIQMRDQRNVVLMVGGQVIPFRVGNPYLIVEGEPDRIDILANGYRAVAERESFRQEQGRHGDGKPGKKVERVKIQ